MAACARQEDTCQQSGIGGGTRGNILRKGSRKNYKGFRSKRCHLGSWSSREYGGKWWGREEEGRLVGWSGRTAASAGVGGAGAVTIPPVQKSHPVTANCSVALLLVLYLSPSPSPSSPLDQKYIYPENQWFWVACLEQTHPARTQASSPKAKPPL